MEKVVYRPKIEIRVTEDCGIKIVDSVLDNHEDAIILEFNPLRSDLDIEYVREFTRYLVGLYNKENNETRSRRNI